MANASSSFFYFYRRYKVRAVDMTLLQQSMVETARGLGEGAIGAAVLKGLDVSIGGGLQINVAQGISQGATGYLHVINSSIVLDATAAASGALPSRALIVCSPTPTDVNSIPSPTSPYSPVPLNQVQSSVLKIIPGTPSQTPDYPSKGPNDAIVCGLRLAPGVTTLTAAMLDFEVKETVGTNSQVQKNQNHNDDRLRPYRSSPTQIVVKSSQTSGSNARLFAYPSKTTPSLFPLSSGSHVDTDTNVDFSTGLITGGDTTSAAFTPVIPSGANSVVCAVGLTTTDTLSVAYGTVGSYAQCLNAIQQQVTSGAGGLPNTGGVYPISYVIVSSFGGSFSDIQCFDSRPTGGGGGGGGTSPIFVQEVPTGVVNGTNAAFALSQTPKSAGSLLVYVDGVSLKSSAWALLGSTITFGAGFIPTVGQEVYASYLTTGPSPVVGTQEIPTGVIDGTNDTFGLAGVPKDQNSTLVCVDGLVLSVLHWGLIQSLGGSSIKFSAGYIPTPGQELYVIYFK